MGEGLKACCKSLIVFVNTLVMLVGLGILAVSIYLIVEQYTKNNILTNDKWIVWVPFAFSLILCIIALVGCIVTLEEKRCCVGFYGSMQLIFGIVILVAGAGLLLYTGYQQNIRDQTVYGSLASGLGGSQQYLSDYQSGLFPTCCNYPTAVVGQCNGPSSSPCYYDGNVYNSGLNATTDTCNAVRDSLKLCPPSNLSSMQGLTYFYGNVYNYMMSQLWPSGIAFCVFGGILFFASFGSFYVACRRTKSRAPPPQSAQYTAGTGAPMTMA